VRQHSARAISSLGIVLRNQAGGSGSGPVLAEPLEGWIGENVRKVQHARRAMLIGKPDQGAGEPGHSLANPVQPDPVADL